MGVTKVMLGDPQIARVLIAAGVKYIGDSRIENIQRMRNHGVGGSFVLLRSPSLSKAAEVVAHAQISFNTEFSVIEALSQAAIDQNRIHQIVIMVELGDLREGVLPQEMDVLLAKVIGLRGISILGIGTNLACFAGVKPTVEKMQALSSLAVSLESRFQIELELITGGNSANFDWLEKTEHTGRINNLRLGESIFLGRETLGRNPIAGLHLDAVALVGEVIESKIKPSLPYGERGENAFGQRCNFEDKGNMCRSIVAVGRQDVDVEGLTPMGEFDILGSSSDHIILDSTLAPLPVGKQVRFNLTYASLLTAMTSPFVAKYFRNAVL